MKFMTLPMLQTGTQLADINNFFKIALLKLYDEELLLSDRLGWFVEVCFFWYAHTVNTLVYIVP